MATIKITDSKVQQIDVPDDFEKFLVPQRQLIIGPSMAGNQFIFLLRTI